MISPHLDALADFHGSGEWLHALPATMLGDDDIFAVERITSGIEIALACLHPATSCTTSSDENHQTDQKYFHIRLLRVTEGEAITRL